jgi:hypothetical protein
MQRAGKTGILGALAGILLAASAPHGARGSKVISITMDGIAEYA